MHEIRVKVTKHRRRKYLQMYYDDPVSGHRVQRSTRTTRRREAERIAAKWEAELQAGRYHRPVNLTWEQFRDKYTTEKLSGLAPKTEEVFGIAANHLEKEINPKMLSSVNSDTLAQFQAKLRNDRGMPETTIGAYLQHLRAALSWAAADGRRLISEVPKISIPKQARNRKFMRGRPITTEEYERMDESIETVRSKDAAVWRHYLTGLWLSGLRLAESLTVSWDEDEPFCIKLSGKRPTFRIYSDAHFFGLSTTTLAFLPISLTTRETRLSLMGFPV